QPRIKVVTAAGGEADQDGDGLAAVEFFHRLRAGGRGGDHRQRNGSDYERAPLHSIISSARPSSGNGTLMPSALAVLRLMISSAFVACCTGRSARFSPLRIPHTEAPH